MNDFGKKIRSHVSYKTVENDALRDAMAHKAMDGRDKDLLYAFLTRPTTFEEKRALLDLSYKLDNVK